ncbi:hypothetical protein F3J28_05075 [Enterobacter sp. Ap-1006]|uniref:hypothetical protein n=1 Tax=Enterobacter sp. Ap-1006 TaxID=2608345 RepID=UPI00141EF2BB|nr:hypothetical protein [Enterobacter sp. Ap-1006]NIF47134.1 hypothetical protein [Enterobacter sp. Ap-1006]
MMSSLNRLKCSLLTLMVEKKIASSINIESDVVGNYEKYSADFLNATKLLEETIKEKDQVAIRCALTRVRIASLNMSNLYQDIIDDVVMINQQDSWPEIPEGYKLPARYSESG